MSKYVKNKNINKNKKNGFLKTAAIIVPVLLAVIFTF